MVLFIFPLKYLKSEVQRFLCINITHHADSKHFFLKVFQCHWLGFLLMITSLSSSSLADLDFFNPQEVFSLKTASCLLFNTFNTG